jgi:hypothetical protein
MSDTPTKPSMRAIVDATRTTRDKNQVLYRAMVLGYQQARSQSDVVTFAAFRAGAELVLDYLKAYDRRAR